MSPQEACLLHLYLHSSQYFFHIPQSKLHGCTLHYSPIQAPPLFVSAFKKTLCLPMMSELMQKKIVITLAMKMKFYMRTYIIFFEELLVTERFTGTASSCVSLSFSDGMEVHMQTDITH